VVPIILQFAYAITFFRIEIDDKLKTSSCAVLFVQDYYWNIQAFNLHSIGHEGSEYLFRIAG